jgi:uncharacterized protein
MKKPWYAKGLRFKCTGCGECCTGSPGIVRISEEEIEAAAHHLGISKANFIKTYTRLIHGNYALKERMQTRSQYDCIFLKEKRCTIYDVRPKQCRTFPWWKDLLSEKENWEETASYCEGINHKDAPLISIEEIESHF